MIIGHLGKDPKRRLTPSGRVVTTYSVATKMIIHGKRKKKTSESDRN
jgi:single-stranded DNA-binding protein